LSWLKNSIRKEGLKDLPMEKNTDRGMKSPRTRESKEGGHYESEEDLQTRMAIEAKKGGKTTSRNPKKRKSYSTEKRIGRKSVEKPQKERHHYKDPLVAGPLKEIQKLKRRNGGD